MVLKLSVLSAVLSAVLPLSVLCDNPRWCLSSTPSNEVTLLLVAPNQYLLLVLVAPAQQAGADKAIAQDH